MKLAAALLVYACAVSAQHLLLSEVSVTPREAEFIEVYNPAAVMVDLGDYYLCDLYGSSSSVAAFYPRIVAGAVAPCVTDFCAKFPDGASIAPGEVITMAMSGSMYRSRFGEAPDYELLDTATGTMMSIPPNGFIGSVPGLPDGAGVVVLFHWTGGTDLVQDVDYAAWGNDPALRVDKTGISLDGPDPDTAPSPYYSDTGVSSQIPVAVSIHPPGSSWQRIDFTEGSEVLTGGNGITGHDETSEDLGTTWIVAACTPGYISTGLERNTWAEIKSLYD